VYKYVWWGFRIFGIFARKLLFYLLLAFWLVACPARFERATYGLEVLKIHIKQ
jgi:hypothetical protein